MQPLSLRQVLARRLCVRLRNTLPAVRLITVNSWHQEARGERCFPGMSAVIIQLIVLS